jgi:plastocyanin
VVTVVIREFKFEPAAVAVHVGDTVEWKDDDIVPHSATAAQGPAGVKQPGNRAQAAGRW